MIIYRELHLSIGYDWGSSKKIGTIPKLVDPPWVHLGMKMSLLAKKVFKAKNNDH